MEVQEVEITIGKNGKVNVHVRGVQGEGCLEITHALEAALGGEVELREMTPEAGQDIQVPRQSRVKQKGAR